MDLSTARSPLDFSMHPTSSTRQRSGPRLGIVGGGQLAQMTAFAAIRLGCDIAIIERSGLAPALRLASARTIGDWDDPEGLVAFARDVDLLTLENEFVNAEALAAVEEAGVTVFPSARTMSLVQDKFVQKSTFAAAGLPVPRFAAVQSRDDVRAVAGEFGWPLLLKARRHAYDGKGNATIQTAEALAAGWDALNGGRNALYVEEFCPFVAELAVIITRSARGEVVAYPVVRSIQRNHVCNEVLAPAEISADVAARTLAIGRSAVESVGGVGSFGIEFFLKEDGTVLINEIAPRVHNTGHYTIEACECSQFENHVRAVLGWPLGSPRMVAPCAVMVNLLGDRTAAGRPAGLAKALEVPGAHVHLYGKTASGTGRKMGHVTALGQSLAQARETASRAAAAITFTEST
jgi:5-(carboxyamino)imidazole ribonucleotide synthase